MVDSACGGAFRIHSATFLRSSLTATAAPIYDNAKMKALVTTLTGLHTMPIDAPAVAAALMKAESAAGLIPRPERGLG